MPFPDPDPFAAHRPRAALAILALALAIAGAPPPSACAALPEAEPQVMAVGGGGYIWVCERRPASPDSSRMRIAFRDTTTPHARRFLPLISVSGEPAFAVVRGRNLHVIFTDGTHNRFPARTALAIEARPATRFVEVNLPLPLPRALAGDTTGDAVYAVVAARQGRKLIEEFRARREASERRRHRSSIPSPAEPTPDASPQPEGTVEPPAGPIIERADEPRPAPPVEPAVSQAEADAKVDAILAAADLVVLRYSTGEWAVDRAAPAGVGLDDPELHLLARDGVLHLLVQDADKPETFACYASPGSGEPWSGPTSLVFEAGATVAAAGWVKAGPTLVVRGAGDLPSFRLVHEKDGTWQPGANLDAAAAEGQALAAPLAIALFDEGAAVVKRDDRGLLQVGVWSAEDGRVMEPYTALLALAPLPESSIPPYVLELGQIALFLTLLGIVFTWRREAIIAEAKIRPGYTLCPLSMRLLAFVLDCIILSPAWGVLVFLVIRADSGGLTLDEQLHVMSGMPMQLNGLLFALGVVFAPYGMLCELMFSATFGKRIVGAVVAGADGQPCSRGRIIVRNLTRVLEFAVPAIMLLVMMTRNRQRIGDIAARTVVLTRSSLPPPVEEPPEDMVA